jgi:hypothetical protein
MQFFFHFLLYFILHKLLFIITKKKLIQQSLPNNVII